MQGILAIQSSVAYGHVGNAAAVFALQRLGFEAWAVNTVHLSNHPGYGAWRGKTFDADEVRDVIQGIAERGVLANCLAVLSGYLGDPTLGAVVLDAVATVKAANPSALWCCDPVMGDADGGFYVRSGIPEFFRDRALPLADIVTPNQFELEFLTGQTVTSLASALAACQAVLARGPKIVLLTSLRRADGAADRIEMLAATKAGAWLVETPLLPLAANGAGDAVAALFLAHLLKNGDVASALGAAASAIYAVLKETHRRGEREIQLIAAQDELVRPSELFAARMLTAS
jgi:pyridoxine kinase